VTRRVLGIPAEAAPQAVADALFAAARTGDAAATLAPLALAGAAPWSALQDFASPASLRRALRLLRDTLQPDGLPTT
jgi:hypothetical protein